MKEYTFKNLQNWSSILWLSQTVRSDASRFCQPYSIWTPNPFLQKQVRWVPPPFVPVGTRNSNQSINRGMFCHSFSSFLPLFLSRRSKLGDLSRGLKSIKFIFLCFLCLLHLSLCRPWLALLEIAPIISCSKSTGSLFIMIGVIHSRWSRVIGRHVMLILFSLHSLKSRSTFLW